LESIGSKLKGFREKAGLNQRELAIACGWSVEDNQGQGRISNYERSIREPSLSDLENLAHGLGVRVVDFFQDDTKHRAVTFSAVVEFISNADKRTLRRLGHMITDVLSEH